jgi:hypothetical protein
MMRYVLSILVLLSAAWGWAAPVQQETELIYNGGFEGTYVTIPGHDNMRIAAGWTAWWVQGSPDENARGLKLQPEYKAAFTSDYGTSQGSRVRSGGEAQQYFHSFGAFTGGAYQQATVPLNTRLRFSIWGQAWSCLHYANCHNSHGVWSDHPSPMYMRIGIDPTGGTDPFSANIVWSDYANPYDAYSLFTVEATASGTQATVFLYAAPEFPNDDNDVFWDDASLIAIGPPPTATLPPRPTNTPGPSPTPLPTRTPLPTLTPGPDGKISYTVQRGETLAGIAAKFGLAIAQLRELNNLSSTAQVTTGQVLIFGAVTPTPTATPAPPSAPPPTATPTPAPVVGSAPPG